jgi:dUTP pyrophosphatase
MTKVKFKRLPNGLDLPLPKYETDNSAGMDIYAGENMLLYAGGRHMIHCGFSVEIPSGFEIQIRPRSGLAMKYGISVLNSPGTIDADYRGEICVILFNSGPMSYRVKRGDRVAQIVLSKVPVIDWVEVKDLSDTSRGTGGFGSTGE